MGSHEVRGAVQQCHGILQLIAKSICASRLVESAAPPQPAGDGLIEQPAIGENIHCRIGSLNRDRAQSLLPVLPDMFQGAMGGGIADAGGE